MSHINATNSNSNISLKGNPLAEQAHQPEVKTEVKKLSALSAPAFKQGANAFNKLTASSGFSPFKSITARPSKLNLLGGLTVEEAFYRLIEEHEAPLPLLQEALA